MSHESEFGIGVFFLTVSSLRQLVLLLGFIPVPLNCLFSLPEYLFSI